MWCHGNEKKIELFPGQPKPDLGTILGRAGDVYFKKKKTLAPSTFFLAEH
jgi:hypothetical protein